MIRNNISTFLIPEIQDGRHNILLSDLLKNPKIIDNYLVVETKMYFFSRTHGILNLFR